MRLQRLSTVLKGPGDLVSRVISRVISTLNGVTLIITLLIAYLLSQKGLQVAVINLSFSFGFSHEGNAGRARATAKYHAKAAAAISDTPASTTEAALPTSVAEEEGEARLRCLLG